MTQSIEEIVEKQLKTLKSGDIVCNSVALAKTFGKQHGKVMNTIRMYIAELIEDFNDVKIGTIKNEDEVLIENSKLGREIRKYFIDNTYTDSRGRKQKRYFLTRKGFDYVVLGFTGKDARAFKRAYIDRFHDLEQLVIEHNLRAKIQTEIPQVLELRNEGKGARKLLTDAIIAFIIPQREAEGKEVDRFRAHQMKNYTEHIVDKKIGATDIKGVKIKRDAFTSAQIQECDKLERHIAELIVQNKDKHYKEIYQIIKKQLLN